MPSTIRTFLKKGGVCHLLNESADYQLSRDTQNFISVITRLKLFQNKKNSNGVARMERLVSHPSLRPFLQFNDTLGKDVILHLTTVDWQKMS